jgi:Ca2+-binding RTX toxin-like protein
MAAYQFETITASEALAIKADDVIYGGNSASDVTSVNNLAAAGTDPARVEVTIDGRTVVFGDAIHQLSISGNFSVTGTHLVIGTDAAEDFASTPSSMVFAGGGADTLHGGAAQGGAGDDLIIANGFQDVIDGGAGSDTITLTGNREDYYIQPAGEGFTAYYTPSGDDSNQYITFKNVEKLHFDDGEYSVVNRLTLYSEYRSTPEGAAGDTPEHTFTANRSGDLSAPLIVAWHAVSHDGADFANGNSADGQITFAAGESSVDFVIKTVGDNTPEPDESFEVTLDGGRSWLFVGLPGKAYITGDDPGDYPILTIAPDQTSHLEGDSGSTPFTFTVTRTGDTSVACGATYVVHSSGFFGAEAGDFVGGAFPTGAVSFAAGETVKTVTINVAGDTVHEGDERFRVELIDPVGNAALRSSSSYVSITDDDAITQPGGGSSGSGDSGSDDGSGGSTGGSDPGDDDSSTPPPASAGVIHGDAGPDTIQGSSGDDTINAGDGESYLRGGEGADVIAGGKDFDDINGNQGNDTASGGDGDDWVVGGKDNDSLTGDNGGDIVYGNLGDDSCDGGDGVDIVRGGQGNDVVLGGAGGDWLSGDRGDDTVTGGAGADIFHTFGDAGVDRVTDFNLAEGDRVMLDPGTTYSLSQVGGDTVIAMGGGGQMILVGVSMTSLTGDWIFGA